MEVELWESCEFDDKRKIFSCTSVNLNQSFESPDSNIELFITSANISLPVKASLLTVKYDRKKVNDRVSGIKAD